MENKQQLLKYYRDKFKDYFSPALLDYHLERLYEEAKRTFSPNKGVDFKTHLARVMQQLNRVATYKGSTLKQSEYSKQLTNRIKNEYNRLKVLKGKDPSLEEVAKNLNVPVEKVENALRYSVHSAIVPGKDFQMFHVNPKDFIGGLDKKDEKVLEAIVEDMPLDKAIKHTGLGKSQFYERRKKLFEKIRTSYIKTLRDTYAPIGE